MGSNILSTKSLGLCRECTEKSFSTFTFPYFLSIISQDFFKESGTILLLNRAGILKFSKFAIPGKNPLQPTRYIFTGKSSNMDDRDDLAITAQMGYKMVLSFFTTPEWMHYHV